MPKTQPLEVLNSLPKPKIDSHRPIIDMVYITVPHRLFHTKLADPLSEKIPKTKESVEAELKTILRKQNSKSIVITTKCGII